MDKIMKEGKTGWAGLFNARVNGYTVLSGRVRLPRNIRKSMNNLNVDFLGDQSMKQKLILSDQFRKLSINYILSDILRNALFYIKILMTFLLIAAVTACAGQTGEPVETSMPLETGVNAYAQAIYKNQCISCHGTDLKGRVGGDSNIEKVGQRLSKAQIINQITNGGNGMIAFKNRISTEEIELLADWLATKK